MSNVSVCSVFREILYAAANYRGSWRDSKIAGSSGLSFPIFIEHTPTGTALLGGSAFPHCAANLRGETLRGRKLGELGPKDMFSYY